MGWQDILNIESMVSMQNKELQREAEAINRLFTSPLGQEVLEIFRRRTIEKPTMPMQAPDGQVMQKFQDIREGENNFVRWIQSMIKKGQPKP